MATYSANDVIDKTLISTRDGLVGYLGHPLSKELITFQKGETIGVVYSWIVDPIQKSNVYWMFQRPQGDWFYVRNDINKIKVSPIDFIPPSAEEKQKKIEDDRLKEEKGNFVYYFEKYGKIVLVSAIGLAIVSQLIKRIPTHQTA